MLNIVGKKKIYLAIAAVLVVASIVSLLIQGFEMDTDFAGGTSVTYTIDGKVDEAEIEKLATDAFGKAPSMIRITGNVVDIEVGYDTALSEEENSNKSNEAVMTLTYVIAEKYGKVSPLLNEEGVQYVSEEAEEIEVTAETAPTEETPAADADTEEESTENPETESVEGKKLSELTNEQRTKNIVSYDGKMYYFEGVSKSELNFVSAVTAKQLAKNAFVMSLVAVLLILIYVAIRFDFTSGICAVIALAHDVLVLCGVYSILRIKIDTNFIAAVLTVLGYSINNTIVIFDRIRENTKFAKKATYGEIANNSINQTLKRSLFTTITTLLTIGMVYILGVTSIKAFALPIIIGILVGTYSSICVSGSIWAMWKDAAVKSKKK